MPPKKKTSPLVWVLGIIGGLVLLLVIGVVAGGLFLVHKVKQAGFDPSEWEKNPGAAAAKMITAFNPDAEVVRVDEGKGIVTIREKSTGKIVNINFDDIKQGRISFSDDKGASVTFGAGGELPAWVPVYPGAKPRVAVAASSSEKGAGGSLTFTVAEPPSRVMERYRSTLESAGFSVESPAGSAAGGIIVARDGARSVTATVSSSAAGSDVSVVYGEGEN